jgi:hypothetical protein
VMLPASILLPVPSGLTRRALPIETTPVSPNHANAPHLLPPLHAICHPSARIAIPLFSVQVSVDPTATPGR